MLDDGSNRFIIGDEAGRSIILPGGGRGFRLNRFNSKYIILGHSHPENDLAAPSNFDLNWVVSNRAPIVSVHGRRNKPTVTVLWTNGGTEVHVDVYSGNINNQVPGSWIIHDRK